MPPPVTTLLCGRCSPTRLPPARTLCCHLMLRRGRTLTLRASVRNLGAWSQAFRPAPLLSVFAPALSSLRLATHVALPASRSVCPRYPFIVHCPFEPLSDTHVQATPHRPLPPLPCLSVSDVLPASSDPGDISRALDVATHAASSLYYLASSVREDWPVGISPGGLSSGSYNGAVFMDQVGVLPCCYAAMLLCCYAAILLWCPPVGVFRLHPTKVHLHLHLHFHLQCPVCIYVPAHRVCRTCGWQRVCTC
jgi:hypothetical protein